MKLTQIPTRFCPSKETLAVLNDRRWICSYSGGKDSTSVVTWIEWLRRVGLVKVETPRNAFISKSHYGTFVRFRMPNCMAADFVAHSLANTLDLLICLRLVWRRSWRRAIHRFRTGAARRMPAGRRCWWPMRKRTRRR